MLLEEATVSCEKLHERGFSLSIENCSISEGKILLNETFKKELVEGDSRGNTNSPKRKKKGNIP